jgi:hypothetical protein
MARAVLLRHDLPDGGYHYDWMIQRAATAAGSLLTFRTRVRIDQPGFTRFDAELLEDHRAAYLDYEGVMSGGRGTVSRVATGEVSLAEPSATTLLIVGRMGRTEGAFEGRAVGGRAWRFSFTPSAPSL